MKITKTRNFGRRLDKQLLFIAHASRMIYGCMGLGGGWSTQPATRQHVQQAHRIIEHVLSLDINVFDHADIYTFYRTNLPF